MINRLLWKEYREQRAVGIALATAGGLSLIGLHEMIRQGVFQPALSGPDTLMPGVMAWVAILWTWAGSVLLAAVALAGERESRTLDFLDILPVTRDRVWWAKTLTSGLLLVTLGVVLLPAAWLIEPPATVGQAVAAPGLILLLTVFGFGCTQAGSARSRGVFSALGWSLVFQLAGFWGLLLAAEVLEQVLVSMRWKEALLYSPGALPLFPPLLAAAGVASAAWSRRAFAGKYGSRHPGPGQSLNPSRRAVLAWLIWRQDRWLAAGMLVAGIALVVLCMLNPVGIIVAAAGSSVLGLVAGVTAFGDEQRHGGRELLGTLRISPGIIWGVKVGWRALLLSAALAPLLILPTLVLGFRLIAGYDHPPPSHDQWEHIGMILKLAFWLPAVGFATGQFLSLLARNTVVAVVLSGTLAAAVGGLWLPSIVLAVPVWQFLAVIGLLLAGSAWLSRPWLNARLGGTESVGRIVCLAAAVVGWSVACFAYRVYAYPAPTLDPELDRFAASLPTPEHNVGGRLIRTTAAEFHARWQEVEFSLPPADPATGRRVLDYAEVAARGWEPNELKPFAPWLDELCAGEWHRTLVKAADAPLGVVEDPRGLRVDSGLHYLQRLSWVPFVLAARGLQVQGDGKAAAALDEFGLGLMLSRQIRNHATLVCRSRGRHWESLTLDAVDHWATRHGVTPALLRRAGALLADHEAALPSADDAVMSEVFVYRNTADGGWQGWRGAELPDSYSLAASARQVPWERARLLRQFDLAGRQEIARYQASMDRRGVLETLVPGLEPAPVTGLSIQFWGLEFPDLTYYDRGFEAARAQTALANLRAARLSLALRLYRREHGNFPARLEELAPGIISELPADPFTGGRFGYRVSAGERIEGVGEEVSPGSAVVWSVGPDGVDDGGTTRGKLETARRQVWPSHADLVFVVPPARRE